MSLVGVIVSRTWRMRNNKTHDTHCVSFELAEERHSTVPPAMCTSTSGQARLRSRSSGKQLTDVSTAVLEQECRRRLLVTGLGRCDGDGMKDRRRRDQIRTSRGRDSRVAQSVSSKAMQRLSARTRLLDYPRGSGDSMAGKKDSTIPNTIDSVA